MALRRPSSGALVFLSDRLRAKSQGLRIVALRERTGRSRQMVLHAQDAQLSFSANTWEMIVHGVFPPHEIGEVPRQLSVGSAALADSDIDVMRIDDFQADEIISRSEHHVISREAVPLIPDKRVLELHVRKHRGLTCVRQYN